MKISPIALLFYASVWGHDYYLPHFTTKDGLWSTTLSLHNHSGLTQSVEVVVYDNDGRDSGTSTRILDPNATLVGPIETLLPGEHPEVGWLHLRADTKELSGTIKFTFVNGGSSSLSISDTSGTGLVFPLIENNDVWRSGFALVNLSHSACDMQMELVHPDGRLLARESLSLPGHGKIVTMADDMFAANVPRQSIIRVTATQSITGFSLSFGEGARQIIAVPANTFTFDPPQTTSFLELDGVWKSRGYGFYMDATSSDISFYHHNSYGCIPAFTNLNRHDLDEGGHLTLLDSRDAGQVIAYQPNGSITSVIYDRIGGLESACDNATPSNDPEVNFEFFWVTLNDHHPYLEARGLDWMEVYQQYRPLVGPGTTDAELFGVLSDMIAPLGCLHTGIENGSLEYSPGTERILARFEAGFNRQSDFSDPMEYALYQIKVQQRIVKEVYLDDSSKEGANGKIYWGTIDGAIGYLNIFAFDEFDPEGSDDPTIQSAILEDVLDEIMLDLQESAGMIIDIRANLGGNDSFGLMVASRFTDNRVLAFSKKAKTASGFTAYQSHFLDPGGKSTFEGPVVLLTSELTISAGEVFTVDTIPLAHVTRIGEPTFGVFSDVLGRYLPNRWIALMPNESFISADGVDYEVTGVPPHFEKPCWSEDERHERRDSVLEAAIVFLKTGSISNSITANHPLMSR